jgi:hypothetical protein
LAWPGWPSHVRAAPVPPARRSNTGVASVGWSSGAPAARARISQLKHHFGWDGTRMDGIDGARIWCGHGVFAHNLVELGGLLDARHHKAA